MSSFQISVKRGGKVVLSESNFVIDLAPYIFTPAGLGIVFLSILMEKGGYRYADTGGIFLLGMNLGMIVCFDYEAFASGQEDIKRNGYFFSFLFVLLFLLLTLPVSLLPGFASPWESGKSLYRSWGIGCLNTLKTVKFHIVPFIRLIASRFH
ncbi:MAG: hypothetical protein D6713_05060 [Deltaproteobacteria bacterium]|nr:MAG: hypothetical protein D6713_05060 [Deltaproteobacteria bacterium]